MRPASAGYRVRMTTRPRISVDTDAPNGSHVRLWLLQSGADPVEASAPDAAGLPRTPQHPGVTRDEVAGFVHALRGKGRSRTQRFDDHGSGESWPRGSF